MLFNTGYVDRYQPRTPPGRGGSGAATSSRYESSYRSSRQNIRYTPYSSRVNETPSRHWKTTKHSYDDKSRQVKRYYNEYEYRRYSPSAYRQTSSRPVNQGLEDDLRAQLQTRRRFSSSSSSTSHEQGITNALSTSPAPSLANRIGSMKHPSKYDKADYLSSSSTLQDLAIRISSLTNSDSFRYVPFPGHKTDQTHPAAPGEGSMYAEGEAMDEEENEEDKSPILRKEQLDQLGEIVKTMFERSDDNAVEDEKQKSGKTEVGEEGERTDTAAQEPDKQGTLASRLSLSAPKSLSERLSPPYSPSASSVAASSAPPDSELPEDRLSGIQLEKGAKTYTTTTGEANEENKRQYHSGPPDIERGNDNEDTQAEYHSAAASPVFHRRYGSQEMSFSSSTESNETLPRSPPSSSRTLYDRISHSPELHMRPIRSSYHNHSKSNRKEEQGYTSYTPDWIKKHEVVMPSGTILCDRRNAAYAAPSTFRASSTFSSSYIRAEYSKDAEDRRHRMRYREGQETRSSYRPEWRETAALVGNMVPGVTLGDVRTIFSEFGEIAHVSLIPCPWQDLHQEQPLSTSAMIIYAESSSCRRAVDEMDGVVADDQTLRVEYTTRKDYPGSWPFVVRRRD